MVLLVTCYHQGNYGSKLQAYATQAALDELGVNNLTVNYSKLSGYMNKQKIKYYIKNIRNFDAFKAQFERYGFKFILKFNRTLKADISNRHKAMKVFTDIKFRLADAYEFDNLRQMCEEINPDAVLVGSDQLWLPSNICADYYTLNFVPDEIKKISYATSFGVSSIDRKIKKKTADFLERFTHISVREKTGYDIVRSLTEKDADVVCDPTILLTSDKWKKLLNLNPVTDGDYIFCYFLGDNPWQRKWVTELKKLTGLKIVSLIHTEKYIKSDIGYADETPFNVGPEEFVSLIENAKYVCTDSFHGTVFSLLFHKNFYLFRRFSDKHTASTNSRIYSLLELLDLRERLISEDVSANDVLNTEIDYAIVDEKLDNFRKDSVEWLKKALGVK